MVSWPRPCIYRAFILPSCLLDHDRAHSFRRLRNGFAGSEVELLQGFALHLQLHLRVLLEDLRVALAQHLCHPLVRYGAGLAVANPATTLDVRPASRRSKEAACQAT